MSKISDDNAVVSHNIINSPNINGYCFVYKFINDRFFNGACLFVIAQLNIIKK